MNLYNIVVSSIDAGRKAARFYWSRWSYQKRFHKSVQVNVFADRIATCCKCPFLDPATFKCRLCDCDARLKAEWAEERCPDNPPRWREILFVADDKKEAE